MQDHQILVAGILVVLIFVIYGMYLAKRVRYTFTSKVTAIAGADLTVAAPTSVQKKKASFLETMREFYFKQSGTVVANKKHYMINSIKVVSDGLTLSLQKLAPASVGDSVEVRLQKAPAKPAA